MAKVLLDTDILSEYLKGHDRNVARRAADYAREQGVFTFTSVTVHEIVFGLQVKDATSQLQRALTWLNQNEQVTPTAGDYIEAAVIKAAARKRGSTVELTDCLIAAVAVRPSFGHRQHGRFSGDPKDRHRPATRKLARGLNLHLVSGRKRRCQNELQMSPGAQNRMSFWPGLVRLFPSARSLFLPECLDRIESSRAPRWNQSG